MNKFKNFNDKIVEHFEKEMVDLPLFKVLSDGNEIYDKYLDSFPDGTNPIFREKSEHDCNVCKSFIRNFGNVIAIDENLNLISIWDVDSGDFYTEVAKSMSEYVKNIKIKSVFIPFEHKYGEAITYKHCQTGDIEKFNHFEVKIPSKLRHKFPISNKSVGELKANYNVLKRSLKELTLEAAKIVDDLITNKLLYRGDEFRNIVKDLISAIEEYQKIDNDKKEIYLWYTSYKLGRGSRFKNTVIGTLISDISNNIPIENAVKSFESKVAPSNYKRPKALVTKKMIENAEKEIVELGFVDSLSRRYASETDIDINNIIYTNKSTPNFTSDNVFDIMKNEAIDKIRKKNSIVEISIDDFINNVVKSGEKIEVYMENRLNNNLCSLITSSNTNSKSLFKWDNNFSWSYNNDTADSIKENVKKFGGDVNGFLRFSIMWNENNTVYKNLSDLDAHCKLPNGHIWFSNKHNVATGGALDVDIIHPNGLAVENITFPDKNELVEGEYLFYVNNYSLRDQNYGFKAEVEIDGEIHEFEYSKPLKQYENIDVMKLKFDGEKFEIIETLDNHVSTKEVWGLNVNKFHNVKYIMKSPNHWNSEIGNKHYMFIIDKCVNPDSARGFYNEFLRDDLNKHRKVFEILGSKMRAEFDPNQLSGLGFSSTKRNNLTVRVTGKYSKLYKIKF